jgi:hypothetical protein
MLGRSQILIRLNRVQVLILRQTFMDSAPCQRNLASLVQLVPIQAVFYVFPEESWDFRLPFSRTSNLRRTQLERALVSSDDISRIGSIHESDAAPLGIFQMRSVGEGIQILILVSIILG